MKKFLSQKLKKIPRRPGVYLLFAKGESASGGKNASGRIIYIGKAINLKKRVQSHFLPRTLRGTGFSGQFIEKVSDIDWIKTKNETEAMLLEDQLIKKYKPRYNIQWKDDKSYFYVTFTQDEWSRVLISHQSNLRKKLEIGNWKLEIALTPIGPFVNGRELRQALRALRKIFPYRTCKNSYNKPCLQWHLGLCPAHSFLLPERSARGAKSKAVGAYPSTSSGNMRRKYLNSLNALSQFLRLYAGEPIRIEAYDISNIQGVYATSSMIVFYGNKPSKSDYRKFRIKTIRGVNDVAMLKEVIRRRLTHLEWPYPDLMLIDGGRSQLGAALMTTDHRLPTTAVIALAKREEEIYTEYSQKTLHLSKLPESLRLTFQAIRDEAHRFAIFYYRYLHATTDFKRNRKHRKADRKTR